MLWCHLSSDGVFLQGTFVVACGPEISRKRSDGELNVNLRICNGELIPVRLLVGCEM